MDGRYLRVPPQKWRADEFVGWYTGRALFESVKNVCVEKSVPLPEGTVLTNVCRKGWKCGTVPRFLRPWRRRQKELVVSGNEERG